MKKAVILKIGLVFIANYILSGCLATKELSTRLNETQRKDQKMIVYVEKLVLESYTAKKQQAKKQGYNLRLSHLDMAITCEIRARDKDQAILLEISLFDDCKKKNKLLTLKKEWPKFYKADPKEVKKIIDSMISLIVDYLMISYENNHF